jgi:hypothetical protein
MTKRKFEVGIPPQSSNKLYGKKANEPEAETISSTGSSRPTDPDVDISEAANKKQRHKPKNSKLSSTEEPESLLVRKKIRVGIPKAFVDQFQAVCTENSISLEYAYNWVLTQSVSGMSDVDIAIINVANPSIKMSGRSSFKMVNADPAILKQFRNLHDPLDAMSDEDCLSYIYGAAFGEAMNKMEGRLIKRASQ